MRVCVCMHRLDFKIFLGSAGTRRRQQASEGQRDTRVPVPGYGVPDLSRDLNYAALIENSTPRSSPPLEAAAPALAVVTRLPPNPHKISSAISGDFPRDRALSRPAVQLSPAIPPEAL